MIYMKQSRLQVQNQRKYSNTTPNTSRGERPSQYTMQSLGTMTYTIFGCRFITSKMVGNELMELLK
jgi:hypothetical protein